MAFRIQFPFRINWAAFIIAFATGILYIYLFSPPPQVVVKFPTPYNAGKVIYTDAVDNCYKYEVEKLAKCPGDKTMIKPQPLTLGK